MSNIVADRKCAMHNVVCNLSQHLTLPETKAQVHNRMFLLLKAIAWEMIQKHKWQQDERSPV